MLRFVTDTAANHEECRCRAASHPPTQASLDDRPRMPPAHPFQRAGGMTNDTAPPPERPQPEQRPRRVQPRITAAPKLGQIYWCDFWLDAQLPEMWKTRPVVVLSYKNTLYGPCLVVPLTAEPQGNSPWPLRSRSRSTGAEIGRSAIICPQSRPADYRRASGKSFGSPTWSSTKSSSGSRLGCLGHSILTNSGTDQCISHRGSGLPDDRFPKGNDLPREPLGSLLLL